MTLYLATIAVLLGLAVVAGAFLLGRRTAAHRAPLPVSLRSTAVIPDADSLVQLNDDTTGLIALIEPLTQPPATVRSDRQSILSSASPIVAGLTRMGILQAGTQGVTRVTVSTDASSSSWREPRTGCRGERDITASIVDAHTGRIIENASLSDLGLSLVGPQLLWSTAAFVVGQHYQAQIDQRLAAIDKRLVELTEDVREQQKSRLAAARAEIRKVAFRLFDGESPNIVDNAAQRTSPRGRESMGSHGATSLSTTNP